MKTLYSKNCSSQNKNNAIIQYLYSVIRYKAFGLETITQRYPEPGHSFLPCDRCFRLIEQRKRKIERVFLPQTYQTIVKETNPNKFYVINVTQNMILNFSEYFNHFLKSTLQTQKKDKFSIMSYYFTGNKSILHKKYNKSPFENIPMLYP